MSFANNLTIKDKQALLLYLSIVLLCAACFAIGIAIGRTSTPAGESPAPPARPQTAVHNSPAPATPDH